MIYNKLVRDNIPEIIKGKGKKSAIHIANDEEYLEKLKEKLTEEVEEFLEKDNEEELADILEVIDAICDFKNIGYEKLDILKKAKNKKRGRFKNRIILEKVI